MGGTVQGNTPFWPKSGHVKDRITSFESKAKKQAQPTVRKADRMSQILNKQPAPKPKNTSLNASVKFAKQPTTTRKTNNTFLMRFLQHAKQKRVEKTPMPFSKRLDLVKLVKKDESKFNEQAIALGKELALSYLEAKGDKQKCWLIHRQQQQLQKLPGKKSPALSKIKTTHQIADALLEQDIDIKLDKGFDNFITSLLEESIKDKSEDPKAALQKQIHDDATLYYNGDEELAKLKIAKRYAYHLQGRIDANHSFSLSELIKKTQFPLSVVKAAEKAFKNQIRDQAESNPIEVKAEGHTYKILAEKKDVIIEEKYLTTGGYKVIHFASDYFLTHSPQQRNQYVTLSPIKKEKYDLSEEIEEEEGEEEYFGSMIIDKDAKTEKLDIHLSRDLSEEEEYEKEINLTRKLQGPGIVNLHKVITTGGKQIMVQEAAGYKIGDKIVVDLDGLRKVEKSEPLSQTHQRVKFQSLDDSMAALERMHSEGLIHRDVKNQNVLLTRQGRGALTDFGTVIEESDKIETVFAGTPVFAPPESTKGKLTTKFDVWSMGIMIYSLCCEGKKIGDHPIFEELTRVLIEQEIKQKEEEIEELKLQSPVDKEKLKAVEKKLKNLKKLDAPFKKTIRVSMKQKEEEIEELKAQVPFDEEKLKVAEEELSELKELKSLSPEQIVECLALANAENYENIWKDKFSGDITEKPKTFEELVFLCTRFDPDKRPAMSEVRAMFRGIAIEKGFSLE